MRRDEKLSSIEVLTTLSACSFYMRGYLHTSSAYFLDFAMFYTFLENGNLIPLVFTKEYNLIALFVDIFQISGNESKIALMQVDGMGGG